MVSTSLRSFPCATVLPCPPVPKYYPVVDPLNVTPRGLVFMLRHALYDPPPPGFYFRVLLI